MAAAKKHRRHHGQNRHKQHIVSERRKAAWRESGGIISVIMAAAAWRKSKAKTGGENNIGSEISENGIMSAKIMAMKRSGSRRSGGEGESLKAKMACRGSSVMAANNESAENGQRGGGGMAKNGWLSVAIINGVAKWRISGKLIENGIEKKSWQWHENMAMASAKHGGGMATQYRQ
jgi:hypothetical protein